MQSVEKRSPHIFVDQTDVVDQFMPQAWERVPDGAIGLWWCVSAQLGCAVRKLGEPVTNSGSSYWWFGPGKSPEGRMAELGLTGFLP